MSHLDNIKCALGKFTDDIMTTSKCVTWSISHRKEKEIDMHIKHLSI